MGSAQGVVWGPWPQPGGDPPPDSLRPLSAVTDPLHLPPTPAPPGEAQEVEPGSGGGGLPVSQRGREREEAKVYVLGGGGLAGWFPGAEALPANSGRPGVQPGFAAWAQRESQVHTHAQSSSVRLQAWGRTVLTLWGEQWL